MCASPGVGVEMAPGDVQVGRVACTAAAWPVLVNSSWPFPPYPQKIPNPSNHAAVTCWCFCCGLSLQAARCWLQRALLPALPLRWLMHLSCCDAAGGPLNSRATVVAASGGLLRASTHLAPLQPYSLHLQLPPAPPPPRPLLPAAARSISP